MFNSLGNINVNPRTGLLFASFEQGRTLLISGSAGIDWDSDRSAFPGAQRLLTFEVEKVIEIEQLHCLGMLLNSIRPSILASESPANRHRRNDN